MNGQAEDMDWDAEFDGAELFAAPARGLGGLDFAPSSFEAQDDADGVFDLFGMLPVAGAGSGGFPRAAPSSASAGARPLGARSDKAASPSDNSLSLHSHLMLPPPTPQLPMMLTNDEAIAAATAAAHQHASHASPSASSSIASSPGRLPGSPPSVDTVRPGQSGGRECHANCLPLSLLAAAAANQHALPAPPSASSSIASSPGRLPGSPASVDTVRPAQNGRRKCHAHCVPPTWTHGSPRLSLLAAARGRRPVAPNTLNPSLASAADSRPELVPHPAGPLHEAAMAQSTAPNRTGPPPPGGGPLSRTHVVPPRPKPGRKPATEEPESKRKAQNRQSQRNFRQRKQKTISDLQSSLTALNARFDNERVVYARQVAALDLKIKALEEEAAEWKARYESARLELDARAGHFPPRAFFANHPANDTPFRKSFDTDFDAHTAVPSPQPTESGCERCTRDHCPCVAEMTNDEAFQRDGSASTDDKSRYHAQLETNFTNQPPAHNVTTQRKENVDE